MVTSRASGMSLARIRALIAGTIGSSAPAAKDNKGPGAGIVELVLELARSIQGVHVHLDRAGADGPEHGEWKRG
jgi:hypothetical protein